MDKSFLNDDYAHDFFDVSQLPASISHAYNPALLEYDGKRWAFVRTGAFRNSATHLLRVNGKKLEYIRRVEFPLSWWCSGDTMEDLRFFIHENKPHISYTYSKTSHIAGWFRPEIRKIFFLKLTGNSRAAHKIDHNKCCMAYSELDSSLNVKSMNRFDEFPNKNWQFFSSDGSLFAVHSIEPQHKIIQIDGRRIIGEWKTPTPQIYNARFGQLRGGTPPILFNGKYWSFFHSTARDAFSSYYLCGLYTFESKPPYQIIEMTNYPILFPPDNIVDLDYLPNPNVKTNYVIYPVGAVRENDSVRISYGINDTRMAQKLYRFEDLQRILVAS